MGATKQTGGKGSGYRLTLVVVAAIAWILAVLAGFASQQAVLAPLLDGARSDPAATGAVRIALALVVLLPAVSAALAVLLAGAVIRLTRIIIYARALNRYTVDYLGRHAPLYRLRVGPCLSRYGGGAGAAVGSGESLPRLIAREHRMILLGPAGAGKTVAQLALAHDLTTMRAILPLFLGRRPLPVLVPLAGYAQAPEHPAAQELRWDYCAAQVRRFGTAGLARALPSLLRRGRAVLLCDGLDAVPHAQRPRICAELAAAAPPLRGGRIIVSCAQDTYARSPQTFAALNPCYRVALGAMSAADVALALRPVSAGRGASKPPPLDLETTHRLAVPTRLSAALAALVVVRAASEAGEDVPFGRARLLRAYAGVLCRAGRADGTQATPGDEHELLDYLARLASAFRHAGTHELPLAPGQAAPEALAAWLRDYQPLAPTEHSDPATDVLSPSAGEALYRAALRAGILEERSDGQALGFVNSLLEHTFAAIWHARHDDGMGRLQADLLRPRWSLPVILWSGMVEDPADIAKRLLRLADTPDSTAARAGLRGRESVYPAALALALAAAAESFANALAAGGDAQPARTREIAQQHLRDLMDQAQRYCAQPEQQSRLARALQATEEQAGPEFADSIASLARRGQLNRLLRAELVGLLGLLASPPALDALGGLLGELDPVLRESVNQAFRTAGAAAVSPLRALLADPDDLRRSRASEVFVGLGEMAAEQAVAGLRESTPAGRAAAAQAVGRLQAAEGVEGLVAQLDDADNAVRIAALEALGRIGTEDAIAALEARLDAPEPAIRAAVAQALGATRDERALPHLLLLLDDANGQVRAAAATALGLLRDGRAIEPLRAHRGDPDPRAQSAALAALRRMRQ